MDNQSHARDVLESATLAEAVERLEERQPLRKSDGSLIDVDDVRVADEMSGDRVHVKGCPNGGEELDASPASPPRHGSLEAGFCTTCQAGEHPGCVVIERLRRIIGTWRGLEVFDADAQDRHHDHPAARRGARGQLRMLWTNAVKTVHHHHRELQGIPVHDLGDGEPSGEGPRAAMRAEVARRATSFRASDWLWRVSSSNALDWLAKKRPRLTGPEWVREVVAAANLSGGRASDVVHLGAQLTERLGWVVVHAEEPQLLRTPLDAIDESPTGLLCRAAQEVHYYAGALRFPALFAAVPAPTGARLWHAQFTCPHGVAGALTEPMPRADAERLTELVNDARMREVSESLVAATMSFA